MYWEKNGFSPNVPFSEKKCGERSFPDYLERLLDDPGPITDPFIGWIESFFAEKSAYRKFRKFANNNFNGYSYMDADEYELMKSNPNQKIYNPNVRQPTWRDCYQKRDGLVLSKPNFERIMDGGADAFFGPGAPTSQPLDDNPRRIQYRSTSGLNNISAATYAIETGGRISISGLKQLFQTDLLVYIPKKTLFNREFCCNYKKWFVTRKISWNEELHLDKNAAKHHISNYYRGILGIFLIIWISFLSYQYCLKRKADHFYDWMVSYPSFFLANEEAIFEHLSTLEKLHLFQKTKRRSYEHIGRQALRLDRRSIAEKSLRALLDSKYSDLIFRIYLSVLYQDILLGQKQLEIEDGSDVNKLGAWVAFYYIDGQSITCKEVINFDEVFFTQ